MRGGAVLAFAVLVSACGSQEGSGADPVHGTDLQIDFLVLARSIDPLFAGDPSDVADAHPSNEDFPPGSCALDPDEDLVGGPGVRRLLRFATQIWNRGDWNLAIGTPTAPFAPWTTADFHYSPCHDHVHFTAAWVEYRLLDGLGALVGHGHKQGFCIEDVYDPTGRYVRGSPGLFHCGLMGITAGYADIYRSDVPGQWVDITGLPAGEYLLEVEVNPTGDPRFLEPAERLGNNVASVRVRIP